MIGCTYKSERTLAYDIIYVRLAFQGKLFKFVDFIVPLCFIIITRGIYTYLLVPRVVYGSCYAFYHFFEGMHALCCVVLCCVVLCIGWIFFVP